MSTASQIHWPRTATAAPELVAVQGEVVTDVLVVGGGLTGCRTALGLAEAGVSVALVDAKDVGWGASGRSGGQCNPIWRKTPEALIKHLGRPHGETLVNTTINAADALFSDIERYEIDCDATQAGWVQAAQTRAARDGMRVLGAAWAKAGARIEELDGADVEQACGSPAYGWALRHATGGHVHPLSLTRGFARAALERGAQMFCGSPVTALARVDGRWQAKTPRGTVTAERVILTTNGYTDGLWPGLRQSLYPLVSISLATRPLTQDEARTVLPGSVTLSDSRLAIYYSRLDRDQRLIFGCMGSNDHVETLGGPARLRAGLRHVFPQIGEIELECQWAGRIAITPDLFPHLAEPAPGILAGLGFSGRGIAMTSVMGRTLAAKVLGTPDADLPFPVRPLARIPLHGMTRRLIPLAAPLLALKDRWDTQRDAL